MHSESCFQLGQREFRQTRDSPGNRSLGRKEFSISSDALSHSLRRTTDLSTDLDSLLLEDRTPLLVQGLQISPSGSNQFKNTDSAAIYAEIYEPLIKQSNPPDIGYELFIVDLKTGQQKAHLGSKLPKPTTVNPVIPLGLKLPETWSRVVSPRSARARFGGQFEHHAIDQFCCRVTAWRVARKQRRPPGPAKEASAFSDISLSGCTLENERLLDRG